MTYQEDRDEQGDLRGYLFFNSDGSSGSFPAIVGNNAYDEFVASGAVAAPDPLWAETPAALIEAKKRKRDAINAECRRRIHARWPSDLQTSINAGLYPLLTASRDADVALIVGESNAARDAMYTLTTTADANHYNPVTGPGWTDIGVLQQTDPTA